MLWYETVRSMFGTSKWAALKAWRRSELKRLMPDGKVSEHFRYIEFYTKDGTPIPTLAVPGLQRICRLMLEPLRAEFGACYVTSGYRHFHYNRSIGGASDSRHVWDKRPNEVAVDVTFAHGNPDAWARAADGLLDARKIGGGLGTYRNLGFIHIDLRPHAARWSGSGD